MMFFPHPACVYMGGFAFLNPVAFLYDILSFYGCIRVAQIDPRRLRTPFAFFYRVV